MARAGDDFDPAEVDRLVHDLATPPGTPEPALDQSAFAPGRPWTTARLLMPARRRSRKPFALASAVKLPTMIFPVLPRVALPAFTLRDSDAFSARVFVALGVLLSAAMPYWPYANAWSWGLLLYVAAIMLVVVTGIWGAKLTWDARLPAAHTVAVCTVVWGLGLLAAEAVPRIGYA
jgi:hypothetical protein